MKNLRYLLSCLALIAILASCKDDNISSGEIVDYDNDGIPNYTVMLYGCGGGNLDNYLDFNLAQIEGFGYSEDVQFTALVKFSADYQDQEEYAGTRRLTLTEDGMSNEMAYDADFILNDPQNLADFIAESKENFPANNYILVFWNHGDTFNIYDQPVASDYSTKSLLVDDCTETRLSIFEVEEAFKREGEGVDLVYWDVCLMNTIENNYQIKDYTRYILGAAHLTPGVGGNYAQLFTSLSNSSSIESAVKDYVQSIKLYWNMDFDYSEGSEDAYSLVFSDTSYYDEVVSAIASYCDLFIEEYEDLYAAAADAKLYVDSVKAGGECDKESLEQAFGDLDSIINFQLYNGAFAYKSYYPTLLGKLYYFYTDSYTVDLASAFARFSTNVNRADLTVANTRVLNALDNMILAEISRGISEVMEEVSIGITWIDSDLFNRDLSKYTIYDEDGEEVTTYKEMAYSSLKGVYELTAFDKATGWSRFLTINEMACYEISDKATSEYYCYDDGIECYVLYMGDYTTSSESELLRDELNTIQCEVKDDSYMAYRMVVENLLDLLYNEE